MIATQRQSQQAPVDALKTAAAAYNSKMATASRKTDKRAFGMPLTPVTEGRVIIISLISPI